MNRKNGKIQSVNVELTVEIAPVARIVHEHHPGNRETAKRIQGHQTIADTYDVRTHVALTSFVAFLPNAGSIFKKNAIAIDGSVQMQTQTKKCG
jgi:hypothetical protein